MSEPRRMWSEEDCDLAAKIYAGLREPTIEGACRIIGEAINRTYWGVRTRFLKYGKEFKGLRKAAMFERGTAFHTVDPPIKIPAHVLLERERRRSLEHASVGAFLCGDPLPGYSALDRVRG